MMDNIKLFVARRKTRGDLEKMRCCNDITNIGGNKKFNAQFKYEMCLNIICGQTANYNPIVGFP